MRADKKEIFWTMPPTSAETHPLQNYHSFDADELLPHPSRAKPNPKIPNPNPGLGGYIITLNRYRRRCVLFEFFTIPVFQS